MSAADVITTLWVNNKGCKRFMHKDMPEPKKKKKNTLTRITWQRSHWKLGNYITDMHCT